MGQTPRRIYRPARFPFWNSFHRLRSQKHPRGLTRSRSWAFHDFALGLPCEKYPDTDHLPCWMCFLVTDLVNAVFLPHYRRSPCWRSPQKNAKFLTGRSNTLRTTRAPILAGRCPRRNCGRLRRYRFDQLPPSGSARVSFNCSACQATHGHDDLLALATRLDDLRTAFVPETTAALRGNR